MRYSSPRFSHRFLKFINDRLPYAGPYEDSFLCKIEGPIHRFVTIYAFIEILTIIDPASTACHSYTQLFTLFFAAVGFTNINSVVEELMLERNLPFSIGDTIKIRTPDGFSQGKVIIAGLDSLIRTDKWDSLKLPYYKISSTVIVRSIVQTIPLKIHDVDKISQISKDIVKMMRLDPNVSLDMGLPYCKCSQESSYVKLTLGCDVKKKKVEKYIHRKAVRIIKGYGGEHMSEFCLET